MTLGRTRGAAIIGRPLDLAVQVRVEPAEDASSACFDADVFHGESRVDGSRVSVQFQPAAGALDATVRIRSSAIIDEPVVTIYLRAGCAQKVTRRYVLLADYPTDVSVAPPPAVQVVPPVVSAVPPVPAASAAAVAPVAPAVAAASAPSISSPAARRRPARAAAAPATEPATRAAPPERPATVVRRPAAPVPAARSRLKLDPLDLLVERDPTLRASTEMLTAPAENDQVRAQAAALWRAINAQPQDILRDTQRMQALEADVKGLRDQTTRNQASLNELRVQLHKAEGERYANGLVYSLLALLALALAGAGYLWQRSRNATFSSQDWWRRGETAGGDLDQIGPDSLTPPAAPRKAVAPHRSQEVPSVVDVDLDVDESMFATLKTARPAMASPEAAPRPVPAMDHGDFVASIPGSSRAVNAEELFDIQQQADFFISLGQHEQAIEVLKNHISDNVETSALAYLDLLKIYHSLNRRDEYDQLRDDFNKVFNAQVPVFDAYSDKSSGLEAYHNALARIEALWPSPKVLEIIEESIFRKPGSGDGEAFGLEAYRELLLLYAMAKDVVERGGNVMDFDMSGLSQPPGMDAHQPSSFSNTSIQPLSASLEIARRSDSGRDSFGSSLGADEDEDSPLPEIAMPRPSPRLGLDIDLSEPAPLTSAFMEIADDPQRSGRPELSMDLSMDSIDSSKDDDNKPLDSNLVDFDLFDAATERDIAPKKPRL